MNSPPETGDFGVKIYFAGQFGNQLFQYCIGKILAESRGLAFTPPPDFVDRDDHPVVWSGPPIFTMRPTTGLTYPEEWALQFGAYHWYDFDSLPTGRPLHVCYGHWCRYELYKSWKTRIREDWLRIPPERFVETDPEAVYIHVRRTDFVLAPQQDAGLQSVSTPLDGFASCLDRLHGYKRLVIVTDDPGDPFHQGFATFGLPVEIHSGKWDEDFLLLASCRQMIMSNSTYSWWAGFLGRAEQIVYPLAQGTCWSQGADARGSDRQEYPNLYVDDESGRWIIAR